MYFNFIQTIKVLNSKELKIINDYADTLDYNPSYVFDFNLGAVQSEQRSSVESAMDDNHSATELLNRKLNSALLEYRNEICKYHDIFNYYPVPGSYDTYTYRERLQILEYTSGKKYNFHHDVSNYERDKEYKRQFSVILYLNDDFEGGGTEFIDKVYKPKPGYALIFPSNWCYPHSGQEVVSGKKRVVVTWYYVDVTTPMESIENVEFSEPITPSVVCP